MYCENCRSGWTYYLNAMDITSVKCPSCHKDVLIKGSLSLINVKLIKSFL